MLNPQASNFPLEDTLMKDGDTTGFRDVDLLRINNETALTRMMVTELQEVEI